MQSTDLLLNFEWEREIWGKRTTICASKQCDSVVSVVESKKFLPTIVVALMDPIMMMGCWCRETLNRRISGEVEATKLVNGFSF